MATSFINFINKQVKTVEEVLVKKIDTFNVLPPKLKFIIGGIGNTVRNVRIKIKDPEDFIPSRPNGGGGESNSLVLKWSNTILVRKVGSYPVDEQDGTVIVNNHNRDFYNGRNYLSDTCSAEELEAGVYYKAWSVFENGDKGSVEELSEFVINEDTNLLDWDNISELIQSGEAQTFGGLELGGLLYTPHRNCGCTTTNPTYFRKQGYLTLRIMGFDFEDVNYKDNPNGSPKHSMTLWSEFGLGAKVFCAAENKFALTEDTHFHKEYELELIITADGQAVRGDKTVKSEEYITFFLCDTTKTGYDRVWRGHFGKYRILFNQTSHRWEVRQNSNNKIIYSSKEDTFEPFDNLKIIDDNLDISSPDSLKWERTNDGKYVILNEIKGYYLKNVEDVDGNEVITYSEDTTIINGSEIPSDTEYYEINPDLNGIRSAGNSTFNKPVANSRSTSGNCCWIESPLRQYLNSDRDGGEWYQKGNLWSNPPSYASQDGFLKGFTEEKFLNHLATVRSFTERAYCTFGGGYDITYDKVTIPTRNHLTMFHPAIDDGIDVELNQLYLYTNDGKCDIVSRNGQYFPYFASIYIPTDNADGKENKTLNKLRSRRAYDHATTGTYAMFTRSPSIDYSYIMWGQNGGGALYGASYGCTRAGFAPAPLFTII